ncbi:hypothetical protein PM082_019543 [Marasmius tenuissimus]|nr:hypothetical protein PM082_019543 [Marasmius tenuissimus]
MNDQSDNKSLVRDLNKALLRHATGGRNIDVFGVQKIPKRCFIGRLACNENATSGKNWRMSSGLALRGGGSKESDDSPSDGGKALGASIDSPIEA